MLRNMQLVRGVGISAALALTVLTVGCGKGEDSKNEAVIAAFQFGQSNFEGTTANRNSTPTGLTLSAPSSVATNGQFFVIADTNNNRILGFNSVPTSGTAAAAFQYGQADFTSRNLTTNLSRPTKVAFSADGTKMLVVDNGNNRVLIWDSLPTAPFTGTFPAPDYIVGDGTTTTSTKSLRGPTGASFIGNAGLAVADNRNNRVLIYPAVTGDFPDATVVLGQRDFTSGNGLPNCPQDVALRTTCTSSAPVITADTLSAPYDIWSDGVSLLISDQGNNRVLYFVNVPTGDKPVTGGLAGQIADYVIGQTTTTSGGAGSGGATTLNNPRSVWTDSNTNYIYVADAGNNRVLAFATPFGNGASAIAVYGQGDFSRRASNDDDQDGSPDLNSDNQPEASDKTLSGPQGMTTYVSGGINMVYVADTQNSRLMAFAAY